MWDLIVTSSFTDFPEKYVLKLLLLYMSFVLTAWNDNSNGGYLGVSGMQDFES